MPYKKKMKFMISAAIILSAISLVLSIAAAGSVLYSQNTGVSSGEIISPKLTGADSSGDSSTIEVKPNDSSAEASKETDSQVKEANNESAPQSPNKQEPTEEAKQVTKEDTKEETKQDTTQQTNQQTKKDTQQVQAAKPKVKKVVYLTFDDGPSKYTNKILDILEEKGIHATFFVIGSQLDGHEQAVKDMHEAGNYVGLHSMTHSKKKLYDSGSSERFIKEFKQEQQLVSKITGQTPLLIRAPYGSKPQIDDQFLSDIAEAGFKMWDWTVDSKDWYYEGKPNRILQEVKRQVHRDTEVILMHEKAQTVDILPKVIDYLHNKGYAFAVYKPAQHFPVNFAKDERL